MGEVEGRELLMVSVLVVGVLPGWEGGTHVGEVDGRDLLKVGLLAVRVLPAWGRGRHERG